MADSNSSDNIIKVLIVEDHALTRMGLKAALKRTTDLNVIGEAGNGQEGIESAARLKPDVVLMDVGMPVMDGIQAARRIVDDYPDVKVIMLTQHDNDRDILASLAAGASGYCLKDVEPERLYTAIRSVSAGDTWLDAAIAGRVIKHYAAASQTSDTKVEATTGQGTNNQEAETTAAPGKAAELDRPAPEPLSARELEVLKLIVDGLSNQEIADKLVVTLATAKTHVRNILNKLAVDDRTQAAVHAMRRGII